MINAFTVDLEDWFCSHNLRSVITYEDWDRQESRVEKNSFALLEILQKHKTEATFFVLGWVADRFPGLIKAICREGHEIASHGYAHRQIIGMQPEEFKTDVENSVAALERITGRMPSGYRAPAFSIVRRTQWALAILKQLGFAYDSSIYPFSLHPDYGNGHSPLHMHSAVDSLVEVPLSCATFGGIRLPCSGGAYLRFYPYPIFHSLARKVMDQGRPFIFYIHPWELDKSPPRVALPLLNDWRHYYNTASVQDKLERLLATFEFTSLNRLIKPDRV
ncbi:MAG: DUF3473 domain-containing protein [Bacteroidota bacterium]|nr:DUF3473 domain-containing protein [Bacteroidota bacterium]MDP4245949.1 DUF3473 domain-containing protein [Bacteroidota bacterium]MDP4256277.1 DUF3473 domain-containing protein [Bacteroidota bacterium]MDP4260253.1 DUF3473 domain-containing protein [Bacteroidota bacterium]